MADPIDPTRAVEFLIANAGKFAQAKANRVYLEHFRKTKKALLMGQCIDKASNAREQFAYSHPEYLEVLEGLREAVDQEERLRWMQIAAQLKVEVWRTQEASNRSMDRASR